MHEDAVVLKGSAPCTLRELADRIRRPLERAGAHRAVAFGSYARGEADAWSDLDLAVVLDTDLPRPERGNMLAEAVSALPVGADLLVYTPDEWREGMKRRVGVFDALAREGVTIYERASA
jgi:predicted nucleotidyltransferase